jgi:hypothetical protein
LGLDLAGISFLIDVSRGNWRWGSYHAMALLGNVGGYGVPRARG